MCKVKKNRKNGIKEKKKGNGREQGRNKEDILFFSILIITS